MADGGFPVSGDFVSISGAPMVRSFGASCAWATRGKAERTKVRMIMKKTACVAIAAVLALAAGTAVGQECGPLNITFKPDAPSIFPGDLLYDTYVPMVAAYFGVPLADFEWCWTQRVVGILGDEARVFGAVDVLLDERLQHLGWAVVQHGAQISSLRGRLITIRAGAPG